jgi:hypothetical protein
VSLLPPYARSSGLRGTAPVPAIRLERRPEPALRAHPSFDPPPPAAKRSKLWELADTLHCSIIGTCLSNAELRHVLVRLGVNGADCADEHELHVLGVMLASRRDAGAKLLHRALDRRHGLSIKQYARAKDEATLLGLWDAAMRSGDIPGAYWALLSHPVATDAAVKKAFRDVHMLSHLVGAANRADIRRLRQLEEETGALTEKLERQQRHLRDGFKSRDATIDRLNAMLARRVEHAPDGAPSGFDGNHDTEAFRGVITQVNRKLAQETARREQLEQRLGAASAALQAAQAALCRTESERDAMARDLASVEDHMVEALGPADDHARPRELSGRTILYVGGRANQIPQLKTLVERAGARFLHHDGGVEHGATLLPGLISRADHLFFPVDCISHDAVATIKRLCRQAGKGYAPLRTASLACLLAALARTCEAHTPLAAE